MFIFDWIKWVVALVTPYKSLAGIIAGLAMLAGAVAWFNSYYEPKGRSSVLEARIEFLEEQLLRETALKEQASNEIVRREQQINELINNERTGYIALRKELDRSLEQLRGINEGGCRDTVVPDSVIDSLLNTTKDSSRPGSE